MTDEKLLTPSQSEKENDNGLRDMVNHIADQLTNGFGEDLSEGRDIENEGEFSAYDYLSDVLDINWILNNDRTYKGARVLVAFGGPNVWIDTNLGQVEGYWWGDSFIKSFSDNVGLDDALEDLLNCQ